MACSDWAIEVFLDDGLLAHLRQAQGALASCPQAYHQEDGLPDINQPLGLAPVAFWFQVRCRSPVSGRAGSLLPFALDLGLGLMSDCIRIAWRQARAIRQRPCQGSVEEEQPWFALRRFRSVLFLDVFGDASYAASSYGGRLFVSRTRRMPSIRSPCLWRKTTCPALDTLQVSLGKGMVRQSGWGRPKPRDMTTFAKATALADCWDKGKMAQMALRRWEARRCISQYWFCSSRWLR